MFAPQSALSLQNACAWKGEWALRRDSDYQMVRVRQILFHEQRKESNPQMPRSLSCGKAGAEADLVVLNSLDFGLMTNETVV